MCFSSRKEGQSGWSVVDKGEKGGRQIDEIGRDRFIQGFVVFIRDFGFYFVFKGVIDFLG